MKNPSEYYLGEIAALVRISRSSGFNNQDCDIVELDLFSMMKRIKKMNEYLHNQKVIIPEKQQKSPKKDKPTIFTL